MTSAASSASVGSDRERLADTVHVLHGPSGSPARKEVAYAAYVAASSIRRAIV